MLKAIKNKGKILKKTILFWVAMLAASAFIPEASALPVFARQTGMQCSSCHFQHFPLLNSSGRAFKSSGFTLMGTHRKVEGEDLSIPATLGMAVLTTAGFERSNGLKESSTPTGQKNTGDGTYYMPGSNGELSIFLGGRVTENAGFLMEFGTVEAAATSSAKLPLFFVVRDKTRAGIVPFTTDAQGPSYGFETLNTGANAVHQMTPHTGLNGDHAMANSAQQYINTSGYATGVAMVVNNPKGFVNLTRFNQQGPQAKDNGLSSDLSSTYLRLVGIIFEVAGWEAGVGVQKWSGSSYSSDTEIVGTPGGMAVSEASAIDLQLQDEWRGMQVGIYATYARTPAAVGAISSYNQVGGVQGTLQRSAFNIAGEIGVIPEKVMLGMAVRRGYSGQDAGINSAAATANGSNMSDNAVMLTGSYKLAQNMVLSLTHTSQSGDWWSAANTARPTTGNRTITLNLFTLF